MELSTESLAEYAITLSMSDIPDEIVERSKRLVIDTIGVAVGTYSTEPIKKLRRQYAGLSGTDENATVFGADHPMEMSHAAFINASMVRYMDFNDTYIGGLGGCHPSDHIGSLISVAESVGASGAELIEAITIAYEIQCNGIDTMEMWGRGFDYVVWGGYAQAAAAGKLMGLSKTQLRNAIGITATSNNGIMAARMGEVSMWKGIAQPYAQHNAIQACTMAREGITGPIDAFEVPSGGVFEVLSDGPIEYDEFGEKNEKIGQTAIKSYTCGYGAHPAVYGILTLQEEQTVTNEDIKSITVRSVPSLAKVYATPERWDPEQSRESADHSIPYCIAVALVEGEVTPDQFTEKCLRDTRIHELMDIITVNPDEDLQTEFHDNPGHMPTHITIESENDVFEIYESTAPGHPEDPLSDTELEQKFKRLTDPFLSGNQQQSVFDWCYDLDNKPRVDVVQEYLSI